MLSTNCHVCHHLTQLIERLEVSKKIDDENTTYRSRHVGELWDDFVFNSQFQQTPKKRRRRCGQSTPPMLKLLGLLKIDKVCVGKHAVKPFRTLLIMRKVKERI